MFFARALTARAGDRVFESGPQKTHLIELFTSQGCSSCPPAEAWLSKLKSEPRLWKDFVPLAFHVDYWDRLGWRDPFAAKEWTARQYQYSAELEKRERLHARIRARWPRMDGSQCSSAATEKPGTLKLSIITIKRSLPNLFQPDGEAKDVDLHVALLGFDLTTKISAGENSGRNLHQDFVVLSLTNQKMSGKAKRNSTFNPDPRAGAIAAWITAPNQLEPIQAVGGWLKQAQSLNR